VAPWAAAQQPPQGESAAADAAVSGHGRGGVLRATGLKTALAGQVGADLLLVYADGSEQAGVGVRRPFRPESWAPLGRVMAAVKVVVVARVTRASWRAAAALVRRSTATVCC